MLLVPAVHFADFILAIHILAVVVGFGATFAYPLIFAASRRADPKVMPWLWSVLLRIDRYLVNPGLLVVVLAGIYLASHGHYWGAFFVQWGIGAAVVIGAVAGSYMIPREKKLVEVAARDVAAAGAGGAGGASEVVGGSAAGGGAATVESMTWSPEYTKLTQETATDGRHPGPDRRGDHLPDGHPRRRLTRRPGPPPRVRPGAPSILRRSGAPSAPAPPSAAPPGCNSCQTTPRAAGLS